MSSFLILGIFLMKVCKIFPQSSYQIAIVEVKHILYEFNQILVGLRGVGSYDLHFKSFNEGVM